MSLDKERIAVVIGKKGATRKIIEDATGTSIKIDSKTGEYTILPNLEAKTIDETQPLEAPNVRIYITKNILDAINYGFNPQKALKLLDGEQIFEYIDLEAILGHSPKKMKRMKGRIIGDSGKIRSQIEHLSGVDLSVFQKYLAIIGDFEAVRIAKKAIDMILSGSPHHTVLAFLQQKHQERKQEEFTQMWKPTI